MHHRFLFLIALVSVGCFSASGQEQKKPYNCVEGTGNNKLTFEKWLERDALYIISESEKLLALSLKTEDEREQFIIDFWRRRDPSPDTDFNEYKEAYYQRIAYANEHHQKSQVGKQTKVKFISFMASPIK